MLGKKDTAQKHELTKEARCGKIGLSSRLCWGWELVVRFEVESRRYRGTRMAAPAGRWNRAGPQAHRLVSSPVSLLLILRVFYLDRNFCTRA